MAYHSLYAASVGTNTGSYACTNCLCHQQDLIDHRETHCPHCMRLYLIFIIYIPDVCEACFDVQMFWCVAIGLMKTWMRPLMKEMYGLKAAACPSAMNRLSPCSTGDLSSDLIWSDLIWSDRWLIANTGSLLHGTNMHMHWMYLMFLHLLCYSLTVLLCYCVTWRALDQCHNMTHHNRHMSCD